MTEKIIIIGAGKTGRGFLARLAAESNVPISFIEKDPVLIREMKNSGSYEVRFFGDVSEPVQIGGYTISSWEDADLSQTDLILVAVGPSNLYDVGVSLRQKLPSGRPFRVITCENAVGPAQKLKDAIGMDYVQVSEAAVFCTTIEGEGLSIRSEKYPYLPYDSDLLPSYEPSVAGLQPTGHFQNFLKRKIFTYNAASGIIAYMGWLYGYEIYAQAANDPRILDMLTRNYEATDRALCREFGYLPAEQADFSARSKAKFTNPEIEDTVSRNARSALRKLGPTERIFGPMELLKKHGEDTSILEQTAAAALLYAKKAEHETVLPDEILQKAGDWMDSASKEAILTCYHKLLTG